jgi:hypothetical protein
MQAIIDDFCGHVAAGYRTKDLMQLVRAFLDSVDTEIANQLSQGIQHPDLLLTETFLGHHDDGLKSIWWAEQGRWLQGGLVRALPQGHPCRGWTDHFHLEEYGPTVILGRQQPGLSNHSVMPARAFYFLADAKRLTARLRGAHIRAQLELPRDPDRYREAYETQRKLQNTLPPRRRPEPVVDPEPVAMSWSETVLQAVEALQRPGHFFLTPAAGTPISDLLSVRAVFEIDDLEDYPAASAAERFANRVSSEARKGELADLLRKMLHTLDASVAALLENGLVWAARQAKGTER